MIRKIISGGQTGVDRAALDVAIALDFSYAGWCPKGRAAEDGIIGHRYILKETPSEDYSQRTEWNVRDSEATLIILSNEPVGGALFAIKLALSLSKPHLIFNPDFENVEVIRRWVCKNKIEILNIVGPRSSQEPEIYFKAYHVIVGLLVTE